MFLVNSRHRLVTATPFRSRSKSFHVMRAHLLPKLRCHFAEFLNQSSLKRLGILSLPTCVGLRYGLLHNSTRGFSWKHGINQLRRIQGIAALLPSGLCLPFKSKEAPYSHKPLGPKTTFHYVADLPYSVPPRFNTMQEVQEY